MYHKVKEMLQKARQPKHGGFKKPLWKDGTRMSNTANLCQKLGGLKSTSSSTTIVHWKTTPFCNTKGKGSQRENWVLSLNKEGVQGPMNQRPDFAEAKQKFKKCIDEYVKETSEANFRESRH